MKSTTWQRSYWMGAGILVVTVATGLLATGHGKAATKSGPPLPPEVSVIYVKGEDVATYREYPARTYARDMVEVRGRVDGYVERRTFDIGSDVRAGQVLYLLDLRPYEAEVERARGALAQATADIAQAKAALLKARQDVARLDPLVKEEAAPKQDLDNAVAARQAGEAAVTARKATERPQALLVPLRAVQEVQGQQSVLTVAADNTVQVRSVVTGDRLDQRWIIEQGLEPGEPVTSTASRKLDPERT